MVNLWLPQDQSNEENLFREVIRRFVVEVINPLESEAKQDYNSVCRRLRIEAGKNGINGISIPKEIGGQGGTAVLQGIAYEELGRARVIGYGLPIPLTTTCLSFAEGCSKDLVGRWMPQFLNGEKCLGIASTEPKSGSDVSSITTIATRKGDKFVLNGEKGPISDISRSDAWVLLARTGSPDSGARGISAFFVEADLPGIEKYTFRSMDDSADLGGIRLNSVELPLDHLIGEENKGFYRQMSAFDLERAILPMHYLGAAMDSIELSIDYTKTRVVWGKPIASFEGVMFPIVEAITKIESVRSFCYQVLRNYDAGKKITKEASMLRWYVTRMALDAIDICIQVNGAQGFTDVVPHQRRLRWVRAGLFGHGSQEIQKLVIGREIMGKEIYDAALGRTSSKK